MENLLRRIDGLRIYLPPADGARLKYFAALTMMIDHAAYAFLERVRFADGRLLMDTFAGGPLLTRILRAIGRQAFPVFCFFLIEGFAHTRSRLRYMARIALFAALSQFPFQRCLFPESQVFHGSVMCTLLTGLLAIWIIESLENLFLKRGPGSRTRDESEGGLGSGSLAGAEGTAGPVSPAGEEKGAGKMSPAGEEKETGPVSPAVEEKGAAREGGPAAGEFVRMSLFLLAAGGSVYGLARLAGWLHMDYGYGGVVLIVLLYLFRGYRIPGLFISWGWLSWYNRSELYALPAFLMLAGYNGKRGKQNKYFFYLFYPVHLLLFWLIRVHIFGR